MRALSGDRYATIGASIEANAAELDRRYPVLPGARQPVHTVYGGSHLFKAALAAKLGSVALKNLDAYGGTPSVLADTLGLSVKPEQAGALFDRVRAKLEREPIEDFRIDFEDGYGNRPDDEEDGHAVQAAEQTAEGMKAGSLPPFIGIRIKPLSKELYQRSLRTLDLYLSTLAAATGGALPDGFAVTLPKIKSPAEVSALCDVLEAIEAATGIAPGSVAVELMVETTQAIIDHNGQTMLPALASAARGRCRSAHFGTYDYTAECGITAAYQTHTHSACDFARHTMQVAFAGTGIMISDGATTIMPVPVHRAAKGGPELTEAQKIDNRDSVLSAWALHAGNIQHSLAHGIYQGWDLHPAQLVVRYAAVYDFFETGREAATNRLKNFVAKLGQATLSGDAFDDAATGQGLLNFFLLGIACGAFDDDAALACGLTQDELRSKSFVQIAENRRG